MSELFGAPSGIMAAQQNQLTGLQAQQAMGQIAMQPAEMSYKQSAARLNNAQAAGSEIQTAQSQAMLDLQRNWMANKQEADARQQLVAQGQASGRDATVADLGPTGQVSNRSQADALQQFADFADANGMPPSLMAKTRGEIATIHEHEAVAGYRNSQASFEQFKEQQARLAQIGSIAKAAASGPQQFAQALLDPNTAAMLPQGMNLLSYEQALPHLQHIYQTAQTTQQQLVAERQADVAKVQKQRSTAASAASVAAAEASRARRDLTITYKDAIIKNGGERSTAAKDAKDSAALARKAVTDAKLRAEFPPVPLDPGARSFGKSYTAADGTTRATWQKDPTSGKGVWVPVTATKALKDASPMVDGPADPGAPDPGLTADDTGD